ncbi:FAD-dependent oxidoreductase [Mariprofundus sp. KV]|uniref:hydroxysqualene dehydroxylase n=1 Tax=Mariprofundus sp. KV TaxID=2608715 RepID=UPI0032207288
MIGGGLCGLTAAIRLAQTGIKVELFEAAPKAGGRTRSFIDKTTGELCDNGPHLLIGAYEATQRLLNDCDATANVTWQPSLKLSLWDEQRNHFRLQPNAYMPFAMALLVAVKALPDHDWRSAAAMLRLARQLDQNDQINTSVAELFTIAAIPANLRRDMLEPICLGVMNEDISTASAATFKRVIKESFASKTSARLGWFNAPLDKALITPLLEKAEQLGVTIRTGYRVRSVQEQAGGIVEVNGKPFAAAILALPAYAAATLLGIDNCFQTRAITNVHLWFRDHCGLPEPLIGGIGTTGEWFFDVSQAFQQTPSLRHLCAVISADENRISDEALVAQISHEIGLISGVDLAPVHHRIIREKRATVLVRNYQPMFTASSRIIDACEAPTPGQLPATIEFAVLRGEKAASEVCKLLT